jgi:hypothetical protein
MKRGKIQKLVRVWDGFVSVLKTGSNRFTLALYLDSFINYVPSTIYDFGSPSPPFSVMVLVKLRL